jgi:hypothetical protein
MSQKSRRPLFYTYFLLLPPKESSKEKSQLLENLSLCNFHAHEGRSHDEWDTLTSQETNFKEQNTNHRISGLRLLWSRRRRESNVVR